MSKRRPTYRCGVLFLVVTLLYWLLPHQSLNAQAATFPALAGELCDCLTARQTALTVSADTCLTSLMTNNEELLQERYAIRRGVTSYRYLLLERLLPLLVSDCPLLTTLPTLDREREFRWSDAPPDERPAPGLRYQSAKEVPPPQTPGAAEAPRRRQLSGVLLGRTAAGSIRLRLSDGTERELELPRELKRGPQLRTGQSVFLTYRREWRLEDGRVVDVVTRIAPAARK